MKVYVPPLLHPFWRFGLFSSKKGVRNYRILFLRPDLESSRQDASVGAIFKVLSII